MGVKIVYITHYKSTESEHTIMIGNGVDYAYFKALLDALIDGQLDFNLSTAFLWCFVQRLSMF